VAKRSPILGYNHNVRYRGLVFHVQTEDSGVLSPHLFTHLFYEGVIVSTRKLIYDAGASEDAIKSLMQAQHKAVLKDLKLRAFDDKIDLYLGNAPGLEPRRGDRASQPSVPTAVDAAPTEAMAAPEAISGPEPTPPSIEIVPERDGEDALVAGSAPTRQMDEAAQQALARQVADDVVRDAAVRVAAAQAAAAEASTTPPRTTTAERTSRSSQFRSMPPPDAVPLEVNAGPTIPTATPMHAANAQPQPPSRPTPPPPPRTTPRAATPPPIPTRAQFGSKAGITLNVDSSPEIEIIQPEDSNRMRTARDTDIDDVIETAADGREAKSDGVPGRIGADSAPPPNRPASHGAATLPPVRQPSRPAIAPAQVVSRPLPPEQRNRENTDAIEVYAPAPPSVELPSGPHERPQSERPAASGTQYSMSKRNATGESPPLSRENVANRVAIPSGLGRPRTPAIGAPAVRPPSEIRTKQPSENLPVVDPKRAVHVTAPISARSSTPSSGNNVVMTRPAVIVGAPPKPATTTPTGPRVRKAREDEGRGFGQGLISEKSLDEVILAYLSEDADEKPR
jgi:hypothetical protein